MPLPRRSVVIDVLIAALVMAVGLLAAKQGGPAAVEAAVIASAPLAVRRRYPLSVFLVVLVAAVAERNSATDVIFFAIVFAGYSAAVHSRFRGAALLALAPAGVIVAVTFWRVPSSAVSGVKVLPDGIVTPVAPGLPGLETAAAGPTRVGGLLVLVSLVSIAVFGAVVYAGDRIRRAQAEHEAATRRAVRLERARIASELHDVVTHNVSVMIVQAGAARQVLAESPGDARQALLAVEASGRTAMAELRHLLGLLSPRAAAHAEGAEPGAEELHPQPGLRQLRPLIERVTAAGLPVELQVSGGLHDLPPGLDLAAFRIVQEALTNVLKHGGKAKTSVRLELTDIDLVVDVADDGPPFPAAMPAVPVGDRRGLLGLRERIAIYGGSLEAGPRPGGGWRVRARLPVEPPDATGPLTALGSQPGWVVQASAAGRS